MTWRRLNLAYQWGGHPPGRPGRPPGVYYTVHLPPRAGGVTTTKAALLLRRWLRPSTELVRRRRARWVTFGAVGRPARWATRATYRAGQLSCTTRVVRPHAGSGYDFARWRYPVRGVVGWVDPVGAAYHAETYLVRPRYV